jgi:hypothetical protein
MLGEEKLKLTPFLNTALGNSSLQIYGCNILFLAYKQALYLKCAYCSSCKVTFLPHRRHFPGNDIFTSVLLVTNVKGFWGVGVQNRLK